VDVTDSGIDNGTTAARPLGLYSRQPDTFEPGHLQPPEARQTPQHPTKLRRGMAISNPHHRRVTMIGDRVSAQQTPRDFTTDRVMPVRENWLRFIVDPGTFTNPNYPTLQSRAYNGGRRTRERQQLVVRDRRPITTSTRRLTMRLVRDAQRTARAVATAGNKEMVSVFADGNCRFQRANSRVHRHGEKVICGGPRGKSSH